MLGSLFFRAESDKRNQNAAFFQNLPGALLRFAADCVEDDISVMDYIFEFVFS